MSAELDAALAGGAIAFGGTLLTLIVTNMYSSAQAKKQMKFQMRERELQSKETFMNNSYERRLEAYSKLFTNLSQSERYFLLFVDSSNELKDHLDPGQFNPFSIRDKLMDAFNEDALWFTKDTEKAFEELLSVCNKGCSLAMSLPENNDLVEGLCKTMLSEIEKVKALLKEDVGLTYIEEYKDKWKYETTLQEVGATKDY
ncbi:hypothetical protein [Priestia megaterium]|uniref:hypothetical protein n=1 Tax=Priestia megaterium TaxID=1404 RepID=UPI0028132838|nr:hypothetical protein [Priestia megaterium]MDR0128704.1 hypothetical protein [Priestia megaterium]